jgi:hypothetical protein
LVDLVLFLLSEGFVVALQLQKAFFGLLNLAFGLLMLLLQNLMENQQFVILLL